LAGARGALAPEPAGNSQCSPDPLAGFRPVGNRRERKMRKGRKERAGRETEGTPIFTNSLKQIAGALSSDVVYLHFTASLLV